MAVKGVFTSVSGMSGDDKGDFTSALLKYHPTGKAQLLALSSGMKRERAEATIFTWFEEEHLSGRTEITNAALVGTTLTVADASFITVGTYLLIESTSEQVFVTAVNGNDLTVTRGFAGTSVVSVDGSGTPEPIQRLGTVFEESSDMPESVANLGAPKNNNTQIFRNSWDVSRTAGAVDYYTGNKVAKSKSDCGQLHAEDIERSLWFGKKSTGVRNGKPFRTMDGVKEQLQENVTVMAAPVKWSDFDTFLMNVFSKNIDGEPNERISFTGNQVLGVWNKIAANWSHITISVEETEFGLDVHKIRTPYGKISLMTHPLFNESPLWRKDLYVLHPASITLKYVTNALPDDMDGSGKRNGVDGDTGVITSELGLKFQGEKTAGLMANIESADITTM